MILCPLENISSFTSAWIQTRPVITQEFGKNPQVYSKFGLNGHNGIDLRCAVGTPIYAPCDGIVHVKDDGKEGYGLHVVIRSCYGKEITLGHLLDTHVTNGQDVRMGDSIGLSGNSGFSTGPHLHLTLRVITAGPTTDWKDIWAWTVANSNNGFKGALDPKKYLITFKGTLLNTSL